MIEETIHARDIKALGSNNTYFHNAYAEQTLRSSTIDERALEASANAGIARFAFICDLQQKKNPRQFSPPSILQELELFAPELYAAGLKALPHLEAGRSDLFTQDVFLSVYKDKKFQATYDEWRLSFYLDAFPDNRFLAQQFARNLPHRTFMSDDSVTHDVMADKLEVDGIKFLKDAPFRIDDPEFMELVDTPTINMLRKKLSARIENYDAYARQNGAPTLGTASMQSLLSKRSSASFQKYDL